MLAGKSVSDIYNDPGCFQYFEDGFTLTYETFSKTLKWDDITELIAFKSDLATIDRVDLHIVYSEKYFTISEEFPGWYQFVLKLNTVFPSILKNWDLDIVQPAFAGKRITIYQKEPSSASKAAEE